MKNSPTQPAFIIGIRNAHLTVSVALITVMAAITGMTGCKTKDPVQALLDDLKSGAQARKVDVFEKRLAPSFMGHGGIDKTETIATLRRYFAAYETISLDFTNIERSPSGNRVSVKVSFRGQGQRLFGLQNVLPASVEYRFDLGLVSEGGEIKVSQASWVDVSNEQR